MCRLTPDQKEFKRMTFFNTWNDSTMEKENRKLCERGNEVMFLLDVFNRDVKKLFKPPPHSSEL